MMRISSPFAVGHAQCLCLSRLHTEFQVNGAPFPPTCHIALLLHLSANSSLQPREFIITAHMAHECFGSQWILCELHEECQLLGQGLVWAKTKVLVGTSGACIYPELDSTVLRVAQCPRGREKRQLQKHKANFWDPLLVFSRA